MEWKFLLSWFFDRNFSFSYISIYEYAYDLFLKCILCALIFKIIAADTMIFKIIVRQTSFQIQAHMRHKVLNMVT